MELFNNIFLINLESRKDRLKYSEDLFSKHDLKFTKVVALDADLENIKFKENGSIPGWNKYSAALVKTTTGIIEEAKNKGLEHVMICEDDVFFAENFKEYVNSIDIVEGSWDMFHFGYMAGIRPTYYSKGTVILRKALCCHCYVVHSRIYDDYLALLSRMDKPIDWITKDDFQVFNRCLGTERNIAFQKPDYSNIKKQEVNYYML